MKKDANKAQGQLKRVSAEELKRMKGGTLGIAKEDQAPPKKKKASK